MNRLNIQGGGFPVTNKTWRFLRDMINAVHELAKLGGRNYIVSGITPEGNGFTDGWVVIEGELLPFLGSANGTHLVIRETREGVVYKEDADGDGVGDTKDAYITRYAEGAASSAPGAVAIDGLKRVTNGALHIGYADLDASLTKADVVPTIDSGVATIDWREGIQFTIDQEAGVTANLKHPKAGTAVWLKVSGNHAFRIANTLGNPLALEAFDRAKTNLIKVYCFNDQAGQEAYIIEQLITI